MQQYQHVLLELKEHLKMYSSAHRVPMEQVCACSAHETGSLPLEPINTNRCASEVSKYLWSRYAW